MTANSDKNIVLMNKPLVSVIIPTYNRADMIKRAINSVYNQTYDNFEIIVVDDASNDNTIEVIGNYKDERIKYLKLEDNQGQCFARNRGIEISKGEYIGFLDSDDEWLPLKLEKQLECFNKGDASLAAVYGFSYVIDETNNHKYVHDDGFIRGNLYKDFMAGFCPSTPSLFLVRKDVMMEVGMFDENLITFVDLDLWLRISKQYSFDYVETPIINKYEHTGEQYVSDFNKRSKGLDLLLDKWGEEFARNMGEDFLVSLRKHRTIKTIETVLKRPSKKFRSFFINIIKELIRVKSLNIRLYIKTILVYIVGPDVMNFYYKRFSR